MLTGSNTAPEAQGSESKPSILQGDYRWRTCVPNLLLIPCELHTMHSALLLSPFSDLLFALATPSLQVKHRFLQTNKQQNKAQKYNLIVEAIVCHSVPHTGISAQTPYLANFYYNE